MASLQGERVLTSLANRIMDMEHLAEVETRNYVEVNESDTTRILEEQKNTNTWKKTTNDVNNFHKWLKGRNEQRSIECIPPPELDKLLAMHMISARKTDMGGNLEEYEPQSLTSKFNSIARYVRDKRYEEDIKASPIFNHS